MRNIILVGFMGTGKTTVAKILSGKNNFQLLDMDELIESSENKSISRIFKEEGESYFRGLERILVKKLSQKTKTIISTGGGIILNPKNIIDFSQSGLVVCLTASEKTIFKRIKNDNNRPLLIDHKENQIKKLLNERRSLYESIPFTIRTDDLTPEKISEKIIEQYHKEQ